ncbi:hypothetical protein PIB30_025012 [Stylosanthes scabra]|uniref:Uncharacterized protein n=1 Tax=Stylosanthes scabra TaxID=79078 RepID=A0ABU6ZAE5_9FABA|nr:hypothetical protein [Stylosanthes scabra]
MEIDRGRSLPVLHHKTKADGVIAPEGNPLHSVSRNSAEVEGGRKRERRSQKRRRDTSVVKKSTDKGDVVSGEDDAVVAQWRRDGGREEVRVRKGLGFLWGEVI